MLCKLPVGEVTLVEAVGDKEDEACNNMQSWFRIIR